MQNVFVYIIFLCECSQATLNDVTIKLQMSAENQRDAKSLFALYTKQKALNRSMHEMRCVEWFV